MLFCFNLVVHFSLLLNGNNAPILKYVTSDTVFFTEIRLSMLHMIFDRFLEIYANIKYPVYMSLRKVLLIVLMNWTISAACRVINFVLTISDNPGDSYVFTMMLNMLLDIIILISFKTTYLSFYIAVQRFNMLKRQRCRQAA